MVKTRSILDISNPHQVDLVIDCFSVDHVRLTSDKKMGLQKDVNNYLQRRTSWRILNLRTHIHC